MPEKQIVTITTANALTPKQKSIVQAEIKKKIGNDFQLKQVVDPKVIGGIKITVGDKEFDVTIAGKLQELASQVMTAEVVTAIKLNDAQRKKILQAIEAKYGSMEVTEIVDPKVIGGIKLRVGSNEFDATIQAKIEKLRIQLMQQI